MFFKTNNIVVSDIITSGIRASVWMVAKSLKLRISVTDGGFFSPVKVYFINPSEKKPGLTTLSKYDSMDACNSIFTGPLGSISTWSNYYEDRLNPLVDFPKGLDLIILNHVKAFWQHYDINFDCQLEVKMENISLKASYFLKSHYMFLKWDSNTKDYTEYFKKV